MARKKDSFDLHSFLPYLLTQAAEESSLAFQQLYRRRYGLLRTEWRVLFHLGNLGDMTAKEISQRARIHKTKISRAVQKLTDRRFLTRTRDTRDRRAEQLALTPQGRTVYRELRVAARDYDAALGARFTPEETAMLKRMLVILAEPAGAGSEVGGDPR